MDEAKAENAKLIQRSKLEDWLPRYDAEGHYPCGNGNDRFDNKGLCGEYSIKRRLLSPCAQHFFPSGPFSGFSFLTVAPVPLERPLQPFGVSIIADDDTVYATMGSLYVSTTEYRWDFSTNSERLGSTFHTSFHKFFLRIFDARYVASGTVSGSVLNQFSMHEYKDTFFIATTDGAPWWGPRDTSASKVSSFRVQNNNKSLRKVGEVGGLGKGERIYEVRYIEDTSYVVSHDS